MAAMTRIVKGTDPRAFYAMPQDAEELEHFPPKEPPPSNLPPLLVPVEEEPEEEVFDPEAIRAEIVAEARAEAERKVREAYAEGLRRGETAGREAFDATIAQAAEALEAAAMEMQTARRIFLDTLEPQVFELATLIARRVLDREIRMEKDLVKETARRALEALADRQRVTLRVHPADIEALRAHKISLLENFPGVQSLDVEADPAVKPGGCMASSETMEADVRLEVLLDAVLSVLTE